VKENKKPEQKLGKYAIIRRVLLKKVKPFTVIKRNIHFIPHGGTKNKYDNEFRKILAALPA
jgi:hypothetical protein